MLPQDGKNKPPKDFDENPVWDDADFAKAKPMADVFPAVVAAAKRGRPKLENPKVQVSLRLDPNVLAALKATGHGWQGLVNATLAKAVRKMAKTRKRPFKAGARPGRRSAA